MKNVYVQHTHYMCVFGNSPSLGGGQNQVFKKNGENVLIAGRQGGKGTGVWEEQGSPGFSARSGSVRKEGCRGEQGAPHTGLSSPTHGYRYDCVTCTVDVNMLEINYTSINF